MGTVDQETRARKQRLYDWYASHTGLYRTLVERDTRRYRTRGIDRLQLQAGDTVVDLGCGPGSNFGLLSSRVGEPGRVVGYDLSEEMVKAARKRAESNGWTNIEVVRADVTEPLPQETFDAAVATLTLSTIPNPEVVVQHAYDGLVPGGRLLVLDARLPGGAVGRAVNPLLARLLRWSSAWNRASSERIRPALRDTFDDVVWTARVPPGLAYVLVVSKAP